jgi:hypothetical protein
MTGKKSEIILPDYWKPVFPFPASIAGDLRSKFSNVCGYSQAAGFSGHTTYKKRAGL